MLTEEVMNGIVLAVRAGVPMKVAAASQGITETTLYDWMAAGEGRPAKVQGSPLHSEFSEKVRKARAEAHVVAVGTIRTAIVRGNWQAALAWIKMRYPEHYAERMEVSGPGGSPIAIEIAQALEGLTEEELASIEAHLSASSDPPAAGRRRARKADAGT
jgi:hypothetical protein